MSDGTGQPPRPHRAGADAVPSVRAICLRRHRDCPHCGRDAREMSARYRNGGYLGVEAIRRIERVAERRRS